MAKKWLGWINVLIAAAALLLLGGALLFALMRPSEIPTLDVATKKGALPKGAFALPKQAYDAIGEPVLDLKFAPMNQLLPDLKAKLVYYGKNGRPDADPEKPLMHFAFTGNKSPSSVLPGERLYLLYDRRLTPPQYVFSPANAETSLWFETVPQGNQALVRVWMKNENGEILHEPEANAEFTLPEKEYARFGGSTWEIGKFRVDGTLLARQRARWYGDDKFLERHGGKEYAFSIGKQRIDFGEGEDIYSVFVAPGDAMIWDTDKWKVVKPGPDSLGRPLLVVKKVDERLMNLELWDVEGKGKVTLNLLKSTETWMPQNIQQSFKFLGARTRSQFVFEIDKERMLLSPQDWLLLTENGWKKLSSPQEIDDYVNRKALGTLFVFDGIQRKDDRQVLVGMMFNPARTEMQPIEMPVQQGAAAPSPPSSKGGEEIETLKHGEGARPIPPPFRRQEGEKSPSKIMGEPEPRQDEEYDE